MARHFGDSDATAQAVEAVGAEEQEKGLMLRALPDPVAGAPRDGWRRSGSATALQQGAAAHIGGHALEGGDHRKRRRRARHDRDLVEPGAFEFSAAFVLRCWSEALSRGARQREHDQCRAGDPCEQARFHCIVLSSVLTICRDDHVRVSPKRTHREYGSR